MDSVVDSPRQTMRLRAMNLLIALAMMAGMFTNTGCRSARDNQIDILERELRSQEDYIYELEDYIVEYSEKLRQYRCMEMGSIVVDETSKSEPDLAMPPRNKTTVTPPTSRELLRSLDKPADNDVPGITDPTTEAVEPETTEGPAEISPENLEAPELELEIGEPIGANEEYYEEATPLPQTGTLLADGSFIPDPSAFQTSAIEEDNAEEPVIDDIATAEVVEESHQPFEEDITPTKRHEPEQLVVAHIFENAKEEATSLLSVIEARDASNEPADFNGKVSLMVMKLVQGKPQRVKRWDFTPEETSAAWQSSNLGDGLHLELPLEESELPSGPLELWVRLETNDGRKILAQMSFEQATLASIDEAEEHVAQRDEDVDGATHISESNPLRSTKSSIPTQPRKTPSQSVQTKADPQWRPATHYSSETNSGFATTATEQQWTSRPIGSKAATETATKPQSPNSPQQWRARK
jgi:hypothetical protein